MKKNYLTDAMNEISDEHIAKAAEAKAKIRKKRRPLWITAAAAVLALAVTVGVALRPGGSTATVNAYAISEAQYPEMVPRPNQADYLNKITNSFDDDKYYADWSAWRDSRMKQHSPAKGYAEGLDGFFRESIPQFLQMAGEDNRLYSPLNVYMALAMLAETTDGDSRGQILDLLGAENIKSLREQAKILWNSNYCDDGYLTSILASSLWLNQDINFNPETINTLTENYYASAYQGEMGSEELNQAMRDWLNAQTKNKLEKQTAELGFDQDTVLALATTIYFKGTWHEKFYEGNTEPDTFHSPTGDLTCDFMRQSLEQDYYWGEKFAAVDLSIDTGGCMRLILPDEGVSVDELLADSETMDFILSQNAWENSKYLTVHLSMPKFDVSSDMDLLEGLQDMGVRDVFNPDTSDFTPLTRDIEELFVSQISHAARVSVDEEGCEATAYTMVLTSDGAAMPPDDEVNFVLNRPFLFVITGLDGLPLFVGVVNQPNG